MKKCLPLLTLFFLFPAYLLSAAPNPQDDRRIEEQKREELKPTEVHYQAKKQTKKSPPLSDEDITYLSALGFKKVTYGYDLCKTLVILLKVENKYVGLDAQVAFLKEQKLLPKKIEDTFDPVQPLRRGIAAYALRKVLHVKGGIFLRIFNESQRYALKELTYEGIMSSGHINEIISGDELSSAITRAVNHLGSQ